MTEAQKRAAARRKQKQSTPPPPPRQPEPEPAVTNDTDVLETSLSVLEGAQASATDTYVLISPNRGLPAEFEIGKTYNIQIDVTQEVTLREVTADGITYVTADMPAQMGNLSFILNIPVSVAISAIDHILDGASPDFKIRIEERRTKRLTPIKVAELRFPNGNIVPGATV